MTATPTTPAADVVPTTPPTDLAWPPRTRRVLGALCLPALFLALLSTGLFDPFDDAATSSVQLRQLSGHAAQMRPLGWLELLGAVLAIGVVLSFAGLTRGRGRGLGNAGVVLGVLGSVGMCLVAVRHWLFGALAGVPRATAIGILDRLDHVAGPAVLALLMAMPVALLVLAAAGWRAGFVAPPAFGVMVLFFVGELVPALPGGELVPLLVGLVGAIWIAAEVVRRPVPPA